MTSEKVARLTLLISLGFAALVVFSSLFLPNGDDRQAITFVLITVWLIPFSYLLKLRKKALKKSLETKKEENL